MNGKHKNKPYTKREERFEPVGGDRYSERSAEQQKPVDSGGYGYTIPGDYKQIISPIVVKADPYDKGTIIGDPYSITNRPNKVIDVSYAGVLNTAGNVLPQLRSRLDVGNKLMKRFDTAKMHLSINYLYLAMTGQDANKANNYQMEDSFEEAISTLSAEVLTQITGLNYTYNPTAGTTTFPHSEEGNALFGAAVLYQTILQNLNSVIIGYNKIIANEKAVLDMSFNTTTTQVLELYNLLKKSTFTGKLKALSDMIIGEYFDLNWAKQVNLLQVGVSHKTQAFTDANLELNGTHRLPVIDIGIKVSDTYGSIVKTSDFGFTEGDITYTLPELVRSFLDKVSMTNILEWARLTVFGAADPLRPSAKAYFNSLDDDLNRIRNSLNSFKAKFSGVRTVFDVLSKSGMMYWTKKVAAQVVSRPGSIVEPVRNRLVEDIYRSRVGLSTITLDPTSYKFRYYTIWDKYDGIAKFDIQSGGSFIQFSAKTVLGLEAGDNNPVNLIPILYIPDDTVRVVNRLGESEVITFTAFDSTHDVRDTWPLLKLNPLEINLPAVMAQVTITESALDPDKLSHLQDFLLEVFGIAVVELREGQQINSRQYLVKPSYLAYVDVEVNSQSEAMLDFCRTYSPFRLQSPNEARTIGFKLGGFSEK